MKFDLSNIGEFYKKVVDFFSKDDKEESKSVATNRLKLVLMQDRTNLNPRFYTQFFFICLPFLSFLFVLFVA